MQIPEEEFQKLQKVYLRLGVNLARAANIVVVSVPRGLAAANNLEALAHVDVLLASVVLLHAALEDFLRGIAKIVIPLVGRSALDKLPLLGENDAPRLEPKKISLGALAAYKDLMVRDLIARSVDDYLSRRTFNSMTEIVAFLRDLTISISIPDREISDLDQMIKRRHQIVHQADLITSDNEIRIEALGGTSPLSFFRWPHLVQLFALKILQSLAPDGRESNFTETLKAMDSLWEKIRNSSEMSSAYAIERADIFNKLWVDWVKRGTVVDENGKSKPA